jgi:hypothetical protein
MAPRIFCCAFLSIIMRSRPPSPSPEILVSQRAQGLATVVIVGFCMWSGSILQATGAYGIETADQYVVARDWQGLLRCSTAWTQDEPNAPMAWVYLGNT